MLVVCEVPRAVFGERTLMARGFNILALDHDQARLPDGGLFSRSSPTSCPALPLPLNARGEHFTRARVLIAFSPES
jgi:hypothetical protein